MPSTELCLWSKHFLFIQILDKICVVHIVQYVCDYVCLCVHVCECVHLPVAVGVSEAGRDVLAIGKVGTIPEQTVQ